MIRPKMGRGDGAVGDYVQEMNAYAAELERDRAEAFYLLRLLVNQYTAPDGSIRIVNTDVLESALITARPMVRAYDEERRAQVARIDGADACPYCKGTGVVDNSDFGYGGDTAVCLNCDAHLAAPRGSRDDGAGGEP